MLQHLPLLLVLFMATGLAGGLLGLSFWLGPRRPTLLKQQVFECGNPPLPGSLDHVHVQFYQMAILFLLFDVESVFMIPWAVVFSDASQHMSSPLGMRLWAALISWLVVVLVSLIYLWDLGILDWQLQTVRKPTRAPYES